MRKVKIETGAAIKHVHALIAGIGGSGKTSIAATAPRCLILGDAAESGYNTLLSMDPALWWDPKVVPEVWAMENMLDVTKAITDLIAMAGPGKKFPYDTIAFDSLSIYAERILRELKAADPSGDNRQRYGLLADALSALIFRLHSLPAHVLWLCHVTEEGGLALPSKPAAIIPGYMDFKWLARVQTTATDVSHYELRTRPYRASAWISGRVPLPDPIIPSFKYIAALLNLPIKPVSPACPVFHGVDYSNGFTL